MESSDHARKLLIQREQGNDSINVAVVGAGWFGSGLVVEIHHWPGIHVRVIFERQLERAVDAYLQAGIPKDKIVAVQTAAEMRSELAIGMYVITDNMNLIHALQNIHVVFEATGDILVGAQAALDCFQKGIHFITVSSELDSTIGIILNKMAAQHKLIYSNSDGDQPGALARLIAEVRYMGFEVTVAGNCKGYLNVSKTPTDIVPWVRPGHNPRMVAAFTDGTKQSMEMAAVANAFNLNVDKRGMHGLRVTKEKLVEDFTKQISQEGIVDFCLGIDGINQGGGVWVVVKREGKRVFEDMDYLKKGKGPYYLFFRDHHLCYLESPRTIVDVALFGTATMAPKYYCADVLTVAKRNLKTGERLDGLGGFTVYGVIDKAETIKSENLLPVGLAEYAVLKCDVDEGTPITYDMVDFPEDNIVIQLRRKQEELIGKKGPLDVSEDLSMQEVR